MAKATSYFKRALKLQPVNVEIKILKQIKKEKEKK